jgi:Bacterial mobilisation protein (MobC)
MVCETISKGCTLNRCFGFAQPPSPLSGAEGKYNKKTIIYKNNMEFIIQNKGGRPILDLPRNKQIKGSFTENDYGKILIIANELGLKPGEYVSQIALTGRIIDTYSPAQKEAVRKLIGMSNNLNQIAKLAHTAGLNLIVLELDELIDGIGILIEKGR